MSRIHPNPTHHQHQEQQFVMSPKEKAHPCVLTVWKRSSMSFQGTHGFTVFDHHGKLAFRVDDYSRTANSSAILMDGAGNALLTLKPQIFSMQCQWQAYRGDGCCRSRSRNRNRNSSTSSSTTDAKPKAVFCMRSRGSMSMLFTGGNEEAQVFMGSGKSDTPDFRVQGCFRRRNCIITNTTGQIAARIARKRVNNTVLLADDVFTLVVHPGFHPELIMAFVIVLDRIYVKPFTPLLCS